MLARLRRTPLVLALGVLSLVLGASAPVRACAREVAPPPCHGAPADAPRDAVPADVQDGVMVCCTVAATTPVPVAVPDVPPVALTATLPASEADVPPQGPAPHRVHGTAAPPLSPPVARHVLFGSFLM
ncbi:MAG TPA: hypothetical protein VD948_08045 [Rhodothermales bacterium]|nr:hypothetical protein [Rhodothermales bacterium]